MIVGLDFDNTIINYENVFHETALRFGFIEENDLLPPNTKKQNPRIHQLKYMHKYQILVLRNPLAILFHF